MANKKTQVEIIEALSKKRLQNKVNSWINDNNYEIVEIKISNVQNGSLLMRATIIYKK
jgi:hypothetical protein